MECERKCHEAKSTSLLAEPVPKICRTGYLSLLPSEPPNPKPQRGKGKGEAKQTNAPKKCNNLSQMDQMSVSGSEPTTAMSASTFKRPPGKIKHPCSWSSSHKESNGGVVLEGVVVSRSKVCWSKRWRWLPCWCRCVSRSRRAEVKSKERRKFDREQCAMCKRQATKCASMSKKVEWWVQRSAWGAAGMSAGAMSLNTASARWLGLA